MRLCVCVLRVRGGGCASSGTLHASLDLPGAPRTHHCQVDLSKRYGCLARGALDIREHPWFRSLDFGALKQRSLEPPIK